MSELPAPFFVSDTVLAIDKPAGWLSVPSRMGAADPRPCLGIALEAARGERLWPVHRLDEEVSGVIVFARTAAAHRQLGMWFEERQVHKTYEALTEGEQPATADEQVWESVLLRGKKRAYESPFGKPARTLARCLGAVPLAGDSALAWRLFPITGRPHQLRYELYRHGYPILGDALYGARRPFSAAEPAAIALRCMQLAFSEQQKARELGLPAVLTAPRVAFWPELPPAPAPGLTLPSSQPE